MERYNPFSSKNLSGDNVDSFRMPSNELPSSPLRQVSSGNRSIAMEPRTYSTKFPDPFADLEDGDASKSSPPLSPPPPPPPPSSMQALQNQASSGQLGASSKSVDDVPTTRLSRQASGLSSFLSRATSVTSSSVTDRVSGAVGSVRNAVDTLSSQIQSAVPTNLSGSNTEITQSQQVEAQQSAASYLAAKISSATGQFTSSGQNSAALPVISRQRVVLILDSPSSTDWAQQFHMYRRLTAGLSATTSPAQSALTYLFSSAGSQSDGADLVEQADFRDVSVLANQNSSTATIFVSAGPSVSAGTTKMASSASLSPRIIRPEYVVVRQRTKDSLDRLRSIVTALNYCLVPMFEPLEIWNFFQDRRLIFAKLLRVQKQLGKENFPLIPQIFFQTHNDLLNYINNSSIVLPCLLRIGPLGKGKLKVESLQMLQDFASIMEVSSQSCTIEQFLDVKCDLIIQKLGTSLKMFKRSARQVETNDNLTNKRHDPYTRQSASRQTSLGSNVLSNIIYSASGQQSPSQQSGGMQSQGDKHSQLSRGSSSSTVTGPFERLGEVNSRYRNWVEAIARQFDNKLDAFCVKIVVTSDDREYLVGLGDCSMDFLGSPENQEEDRRSFVELVISHMNTVLPKTSSAMLVSAPNQDGQECDYRRGSGGSTGSAQIGSPKSSAILTSDKRKFASQTQIDSSAERQPNSSSSSAQGHPVGLNQGGRAYGQLGNRSKSVIVNQHEQHATTYSSLGLVGSGAKTFYRRSSDRTDSLANDSDDLSGYAATSSTALSGGGLDSQSRQSSLGQTFLDQTSTAFSSFQKQSLSFFRRLDGGLRPGDLISSTPPQSAKSDKAFDRSFRALGPTSGGEGSSAFTATGASHPINNTPGGLRNGLKSQSIDSSSIGPSSFRSSIKRQSPPKPPPPAGMQNRQSSLASFQSGRRAIASTTPNSTPLQTRQNSEADTSEADSSSTAGQRATRVIRQNSALSAFEPFDPDLAPSTSVRNTASDAGTPTKKASIVATGMTRGSIDIAVAPQSGSRQSSISGVQQAVGARSYDSVSVTSGDSNSTGAEDTMNNLKKTFASIFGDRCE